MKTTHVSYVSEHCVVHGANTVQQLVTVARPLFNRYVDVQMDYPEVLKPENAVKDDETFGSSEVHTLKPFLPLLLTVCTLRCSSSRSSVHGGWQCEHAYMQTCCYARTVCTTTTNYYYNSSGKLSSTLTQRPYRASMVSTSSSTSATCCQQRAVRIAW
jgi:hypothetical protein